MEVYATMPAIDDFIQIHPADVGRIDKPAESSDFVALGDAIL